jgi:hypothetical protein
MSSRHVYQERVEKALDRSRAHIRHLRARLEKTEGEVRLEYQMQLEVLATIYTKASARLQVIEGAEDERWLTLKPAMDGMLSELRNALAAADSRIH